jgi:hypothetical protein
VEVLLRGMRIALEMVLDIANETENVLKQMEKQHGAQDLRPKSVVYTSNYFINVTYSLAAYYCNLTV